MNDPPKNPRKRVAVNMPKETNNTGNKRARKVS